MGDAAHRRRSPSAVESAGVCVQAENDIIVQFDKDSKVFHTPARRCAYVRVCTPGTQGGTVCVLRKFREVSGRGSAACEIAVIGCVGAMRHVVPRML
jgi:hypothetical protein